MEKALRRLAAWTVVLIGAVLVFIGLVDLAVGPELSMVDANVSAEEAGSRWTGLIVLALGAGLMWFGTRISRPAPRPDAPP